LNKKKDELTEELRRLEEEVRDIRRESGPVKMSKAEREKEANQAYYEEMRKKLRILWDIFKRGMTHKEKQLCKSHNLLFIYSKN
jgi:ElaB/YqjD/DUF883 family membrane-anchored ribosome-binding protein